MASPIAASAPAKVKVYKINTWPNMSSSNTEKIAKLKLIANSINSIETNIIMMFLRVIKIPKIPKKNIRVEKINKKNILKLVITTQYKNYLTKTLLKV